MAVVFVICPLFKETMQEKLAVNPGLREKFEDFKKTKEVNHMANFGSSDKMFNGEANFIKAVPKLRKAHLTHDLSIFYRLSGANPTVIELYGVFTHDEAGIGQPAHTGRQKQLGKKLVRQEFDALPQQQQQPPPQQQKRR